MNKDKILLDRKKRMKKKFKFRIIILKNIKKLYPTKL